MVKDVGFKIIIVKIDMRRILGLIIDVILLIDFV